MGNSLTPFLLSFSPFPSVISQLLHHITSASLACSSFSVPLFSCKVSCTPITVLMSCDTHSELLEGSQATLSAPFSFFSMPITCPHNNSFDSPHQRSKATLASKAEAWGRGLEESHINSYSLFNTQFSSRTPKLSGDQSDQLKLKSEIPMDHLVDSICRNISS